MERLVRAVDASVFQQVIRVDGLTVGQRESLAITVAGMREINRARHLEIRRVRFTDPRVARYFDDD